MEAKKCPECGRYSVSFNYHRGVWNCVYLDCNYSVKPTGPPEEFDTSRAEPWDWKAEGCGDICEYCPIPDDEKTPSNCTEIAPPTNTKATGGDKA